MKDYSKTVVYKIVCKDVEIKEFYVGSTTDFNRRMYIHKSVCNNPNTKEYNLKVYRFIRENGGFENWDFIVVEKYPCENDIEKLKREMYWCDELHSTLNTYRPILTEEQRLEYRKDYREKNREQIIEKKKEYREKNRELINEKRKEYREKNREMLVEKNKEHYKKHKEQFAEKGKVYREKNKERLAERMKEKILCPKCGKEMRRDSISAHIKRVHRI
jgi:hypothetical protein